MIITEQMIRELQRRVDITYEDAEKLLRRSGGNIDKAEDDAIKRTNSFGNRFLREVEKIFNSTLIYKLRIFKNEEQFINIPILGLFVLAIVIGVNKSLVLGIVSIIIVLLAEATVEINKVQNHNEFRFYKTINKETMTKSEKTKSSVNKSTDDDEVENRPKEKDNHQQADDDEVVERDAKEDDYYEVTIDK